MRKSPTRDEIEAHIRNTIRYWVWSGYYDVRAVERMLPDLFEGDIDTNAMFAAIPEAFAAKAHAEVDWPPVTDCDRLDIAFRALEAIGVCALQNAGYTMSDGITDVHEAMHERRAKRYQGYCFFHGQDVEHAIDGHGLWIAYGGFKESRVSGVEIGRRVVAALHGADLVTEWDGSEANRIRIPKLEWRRRAQKRGRGS